MIESTDIKKFCVLCNKPLKFILDTEEADKLYQEHLERMMILVGYALLNVCDNCAFNHSDMISDFMENASERIN